MTSGPLLQACAPALSLGNTGIYMLKSGSVFRLSSVTFKTVQQIELGQRAQPDGPSQTRWPRRLGLYSRFLLLLQGRLVKRRIQYVLWEGSHTALLRGGGGGESAKPGWGGTTQPRASGREALGFVIEM